MRRLPLSLFFTCLFTLAASAHEFWISPNSYMVSPDQQIEANIRVGQNFKGGAYSFVPAQFVRFDLVQSDTVIPVQGTVGDRPALTMPAPDEGLVIAVHQTTDSFVTYRDAALFENFVRHKDFAWALDQHVERGLPETGFHERYSRYAKSLIAIGSGGGADRPVGMETEIVALANPYTDDMATGLPVQVFYQGDVRADVQVELFERDPAGEVLVTLHRTDEKGVAVIPVKPGHEYLVDAVVMRALDVTEDNRAPWESLWASLTFKLP